MSDPRDRNFRAARCFSAQTRFRSGEFLLRKLLIGAIAVPAILAMAAAPAVAQTPESSLRASVTPKKAGTKKKPRSTSFRIDLKLNKPGTTVEFIELNLASTLKLSGKGLNTCSQQDLEFDPASCDDAKAGPQGRATAAQGPPATAVPISFAVQPYVAGPNTLLFFVVGEQGLAVQSPITAKLSNGGRKLRLQIPQELRQPGGTDASLTGLTQAFRAKKGKNSLVTSTGCKNRKHAVSGKLTFSQRIDGLPVPAPLTTKANARCSK
jgi:hypothetical protein